MALVIGVVFSLIFTEISGIVPAGLVVPGYLALVYDRPMTIVFIILISLLTYLVVTKLISRWTILYGRRKFAAMVIVAILLKLGFDSVYPMLPLGAFDIGAIGVVVPGLIASGIDRQGVVYTLGSALILGGLTFITIFVYNMF